MSLGEVLRRGRERHPDKPALLFESERWSYARMDEITDRIGVSLQRQGLRSGDRVALLLANCPEMPFVYYASWKLGAIAVPLNPRLKGPELEYLLGHSGARVLIAHDDLFPAVGEVRSRLPHLELGAWSASPAVRAALEINALFIIGALLAPLLAWALFNTRLGLIIRTVGDNADAARARGASGHLSSRANARDLIRP